ncbi:homoserine O-acetyltransferase [Sporichthya sp.]|uniref:homoserine O-acetyltransferase MetX n=1 Tax=Sporichthya sp. TaxID=65475 RepID=UPI00182FD3AB|nr:homoserine O-acetyltransferase [Sporichthya sp.]MBA3742042.1 homoserine O-acetyltransferase [Sporichthya sp.]
MSPRPGGWREGDPAADRRFADLGAIDLELGGHLPGVTLAYETWGTLDADASNAVLVLHALTGDAHVHGVAGPGQPTAGWWDGLIGPGRPLDTERVFVVAANVLGGCQGSTGPSSRATDGRGYGRPYGSRFPRVTVGDQVRSERLLSDHLGVRRWAAVLGGSMGGMRALEWAYAYPDRVGAALVVAVGAAATGDQIGTQSTQIAAIRADPGWAGGDYYDEAGGGPWAGMEIARRIAHLTYRSEYELQDRFAGTPQAGEDPLAAVGPGRFAVQSYLDHQAVKLSRRFDPGTYVALTDAMNTWDLGRGRGGLEAALGRIEVPLLVGGVNTDRLYPLWQQEQIATAPGTVKGLRVISSPSGHDGFLIERDQIFALTAEAVGIGLGGSSSIEK